MAQGDVTRIASNIGALNALNSLVNINKQLALHQGRISTGKRINSAADDPAGLTIATKMLARSEGLKTALSNISDASNLLSVAESGLSKMNDILVMMRSKAQQASSETLGGTERTAIQTQLESYAEQIGNIVSETKWNGDTLLDGTASKQFQTGAEYTDTTTWTLATSHRPNSLAMGISENNTSVALAKISNTGTSFGAIAPSADSVFTGLAEATTGQYTLTNLGMATSSTAGKSSLVTGSSFLAGISSLNTLAEDMTAVTANQITSGIYTVTLSTVDGGTNKTTDWSLTDSTGNIVASASGDSIAGSTLDLKDAAGKYLGLSFNINSNLQSGGSMKVEYIAANHIKYNLKDGSGTIQNVDQDGVSGGVISTVGYAAVGANSLHTGTNIKTSVGSIASSAVGDTLKFTYKQVGDYVVDVSTVAKASAYMNTVDLAMNKVNESMTSLGSLMARLQFKEDQVSTAQVNVEASYSRIMNANMAEEQVNASKYTILQQTATAMLAQANTAPQNLLTLFR